MKFATKSAAYVVIALAAFLVIGVPSVQAQHGSEGTVTVTVLDPSSSVVQGADLELRDVSTNNIRRAATQDQGVHTFPNLSLGKYSLTVKKAGFQSQEFTDVIVEAAKTSDITANLKVGGNSAPAVTPRLESIEEMTVQTEQPDMNQGFGQASMQINFVTRRGGNAFHGRVFEDFRNAALNANSWKNDALTAIDPSNPQ